MLIISNDEIRKLLTMKDCMAALEESYVERFGQRALSRPRSDLYAPKGEGRYYVFKSMEGLLPSQNVAALRLNSDIIQWRQTEEGTRKEKIPLADGNWVGLVALFDTNTGKLLSIFPDGVTQGFRVAATGGLAIKHMARPDAKTMGLFGAGWQAETQILSACAVRSLEYIKVYSPTRAKREAFAERMTRLAGVRVIPVEHPQEAAEGLDIVATTTNSVTPVLKAEWISPGTHLSCVKDVELGPEVIDRADFISIHTNNITPENYMIGQGETKIHAHDPTVKGEHKPSEKGWEKADELHTVIGGGVKARVDAGQITCFINNIGLGLQFAAVGALIYRKAKEQGIGTDLPDGWFTEDVHP
jgi:ornithine cyclodeaminase/alanine dehydrogenase-like protein (mu-crystallin family)